MGSVGVSPSEACRQPSGQPCTRVLFQAETVLACKPLMCQPGAMARASEGMEAQAAVAVGHEKVHWLTEADRAGEAYKTQGATHTANYACSTPGGKRLCLDPGNSGKVESIQLKLGKVVPEKQVKYGIIGTGMMGVEHVYNLAYIAGARIVAIADPHGPSRQAAFQAIGSNSVQVFNDHKALLDSGLCDVVVVASPNMTHAQILKDILQHKKPHHILVEKPLCTTMEDCNEVTALAGSRKDVMVQVGLEYRYMPPIARLITEVKRGTMGRIRMVSIREHRFPFLVKVDNWNRFSKNTGGTLVEKCCHFFDLMTLILGSKPVRVMASGSQAVNHLDEDYNGQVPDILDNAYVIVEYESGARGLLDLCMFAEGSRNEQEISVVGDAGKIEAFVPESIVRIGTRAGRRESVQTIECHNDKIKYEGLHHGSSYLEHLDFIKAVQSHGELVPAVSLREGMLSVAVGLAAHKSIELGRHVLLAEVMDVAKTVERPN